MLSIELLFNIRESSEIQFLARFTLVFYFLFLFLFLPFFPLRGGREQL